MSNSHSQDLSRASALHGALRQSAHPRIHAIAKPYSRPSSFAGVGLSSSATMSDLDLSNVSSSLQLSPTKSPAKVAPSTRNRSRPSLSTSSSFGSLPRSGSESSLFSGIKSIFSRPLQWLATPAKNGSPEKGHPGSGVYTTGKRDSLSSFGHDLEDPESPSDRRDGKRLRRASPSPERPNGHGDYEPESRFEVTGRAVSGFMLPPLSPHVTLKPKSHLPTASSNGPSSSSNPTNFSRPLGASGSGLTSSKSMSYLDPTPDVLGGSPRKGGMLTRSKRVELSSLVDDDQAMAESDTYGISEKGKGREGETWSPWKSRYSTAGGAASSAAVGRPTTPGRKTPSRMTESRDYALPSASPFKAPPSPLARQSPAVQAIAGASSLTRSATTTNIRRAASVTSDVSMGLARSGSVRGGLRQSGSMLFGSVNGDRQREREDDKMSVDGEQRQREGSVLDWFMRDRWDGKAGSPGSVAASRRLGSAGPSLSHPPIRKGQLVWNEDEKAFVRESELRAAQAPPAIHKSEAERILFTLESMRKTPLADARKDLPSSIGQSSRTLRKTINVPLATAAAGDSAKQRRDKERLGGEDRVSVMISPYGRRKVADMNARDERRKAHEERDYRPSPTPTASDARSDTRSRSQVSDVDMGSSHKASSPVPPTPRRSSRLRRQPTADDDDAPAPTPKARKSKRGTSKQPDSHQDEAPTPRNTRRTRNKTVERGTSPTPPPAVPSVPTITATAPSPGGPSDGAAVSSTYQPLADGERSRGGSSLRAKSDVSKRTHQGAANYSRSATPSSSGRFSAKEEDLPDMEDLEQSKIPLPSFSGISFAGLGSGTATPTGGNAAAPAQEGSSATSSSTAQAGQSLGVPPPTRRPGGPLARLGHSSTRPRASSPLAAGSIVPDPESPPAGPKPSKPVESVAPPSNGFFALNGSTPAATGSTTPQGKPSASSFFSQNGVATSSASDDASKKSFSFGLGQPPTTSSSGSTEGADRPATGGIPDFFGKKSAPPSGTTTPTSLPALDFGLPKKPAAEQPKAAPVELPAPSFSFGKPAIDPKKDAAPTPASGGFSFGAPAAKPAEKEKDSTPAFSFGAPASKPAETSKPAFSFGSAPTPAPAEKPTEPAKPAFSFGAPATTTPAKPAEAAKPAFSFGSSTTPATEKPAEAAKPAFSFGSSSSTAPPPAAKPAETAKPAFSFGAGSSTPAASSTPAFGGFGASSKPAENKTSTQTASGTSNPFGSSNGSTAASSSFTFGAPSSAGASSPFGAPSQANGTADAAKSNPFGSSTSGNTSSAPASTGFNFGAPSSTGQANGGSSAFGASGAPSSQPSNPFGFGSSSAAASPSIAPTSNPFGAPAPASPAATPAFSFGASSSTPAAAAAAPAFGAAPSAAPSNPFGQPAPAASPAPAAGGFNFTFGAGGSGAAPPAPAATPAPGGFNFGQAPLASTPTTPSTSFTFGAPNPAPSTPSANASPAFAFGAGPGVSTTPAAAPPSSGFSFGAPAGAPQPPRFGSPAPADAAAGGFSLGMDAPASPGGRKVKGLPRRGAVKR
ncbi:hypothetical protein IAU59_002700 [Kwoniella sp. CBS 9459]